MTDDETPAKKFKLGPGIVAPISRINLALPFSKISVEEPSKEFAELSAIVAALLALLESNTPGDSMTVLRQRAEALAAGHG